MAVNLLGSSDARVDFGDLAIDAGLTAITVSITILALDVASDELVVSHWGTSAAHRAWLMQIQDTNELGFVVHKNPNFFGRKTTDLNLATGTLYRIVCRWRTSDDTVTIWAGDYFIIRVTRDPTPDSGINVTGDTSIHFVSISET